MLEFAAASTLESTAGGGAVRHGCLETSPRCFAGQFCAADVAPILSLAGRIAGGNFDFLDAVFLRAVSFGRARSQDLGLPKDHALDLGGDPDWQVAGGAGAGLLRCAVRGTGNADLWTGSGPVAGHCAVDFRFPRIHIYVPRLGRDVAFYPAREPHARGRVDRRVGTLRVHFGVLQFPRQRAAGTCGNEPTDGHPGCAG